MRNGHAACSKDKLKTTPGQSARLDFPMKVFTVFSVAELESMLAFAKEACDSPDACVVYEAPISRAHETLYQSKSHKAYLANRTGKVLHIQSGKID